MSHARETEGSVRKKDNRRKLQRQARSSRKEEEKLQKAEELKRLKNLKMKEIHDRLKKIQEITGNSGKCDGLHRYVCSICVRGTNCTLAISCWFGQY